MIVESIYTTPGVKGPTLDTTEEDILKEWKKICEQRYSLVEQIANLKQTIDLNNLTNQNVVNLEILHGQIEVSPVHSSFAKASRFYKPEYAHPFLFWLFWANWRTDAGRSSWRRSGSSCAS